MADSRSTGHLGWSCLIKKCLGSEVKHIGRCLTCFSNAVIKLHNQIYIYMGLIVEESKSWCSRAWLQVGKHDTGVEAMSSHPDPEYVLVFWKILRYTDKLYIDECSRVITFYTFYHQGGNSTSYFCEGSRLNNWEYCLTCVPCDRVASRRTQQEKVQ